MSPALRRLNGGKPYKEGLKNTVTLRLNAGQLLKILICYYLTTHVVRLKLFRLKAEGIRKARLQYFGGM